MNKVALYARVSISGLFRTENEIIKGKRSVTALSAIDSADALGTTPEFWLNLQQTWDLAQAYKAKKKAA